MIVWFGGMGLDGKCSIEKILIGENTVLKKAAFESMSLCRRGCKGVER